MRYIRRMEREREKKNRTRESKGFRERDKLTLISIQWPRNSG